MIGIINYGSGNIGAIANIYKQLKIPYLISSDLRELARADRFILPGVGSFDPTMKHLNDSGLLKMLNDQVHGERKPIMGICVGMQILAEFSEEGEMPGLGWIKGKVKKIDASKLHSKPKLPHMGWNSLTKMTDESLFQGIDADFGFYFLHSYFFDADTPNDIIASVNYGVEMPCAVRNKNIVGVQFHPEKSHHNGMMIFRNFADF